MCPHVIDMLVVVMRLEQRQPDDRDPIKVILEIE